MKWLKRRGVRRLVQVGLGVGTFCGAWVGWQSYRTPGGFEEWLGDTVSDLRTSFPVLLEPVDTLRDTVHELQYRTAVWWEHRRGDAARRGDPGAAAGVGQDAGGLEPVVMAAMHREHPDAAHPHEAGPSSRGATTSQNTEDPVANSATESQHTTRPVENASPESPGTATPVENSSTALQNTARPGEITSLALQDAARLEDGTTLARQDAARLQEGTTLARQDAARLQEGTTPARQDAARLQEGTTFAVQDVPRGDFGPTRAMRPSSPPATSPMTRPGEPIMAGPGGRRPAVDADTRLALATPPERPAAVTVPIRWQPWSPEGPSWLEVARIAANPEFPRATALLLRIDVSRAQVHWQPGSLHPWNTTSGKRRLPDAVPVPDRSGRIPSPFPEGPVLAFGGGFESLGFWEYGAVHRGRTVVPLARKIQTIAIYQDGSVRMGPWGSAGMIEAGVIEARQNLPPLVHQGRVPAGINWLNVGTMNISSTRDEHNRQVYPDVHTWRSGLGLTMDGDLVYAFGPHLTPRLLATTLIRAGAMEAMQLDINAAYHAAPSLFLRGAKGIPELLEVYPGVRSGQRFLAGSRKDFFYISSR